MHPVFFEIPLFGGVPIRFFGLFILDAFLFATLWVQWLYVQQRNPEAREDVSLRRFAWLCIAGIVASRVLLLAIPGPGWKLRLGTILVLDLVLLIVLRIRLRGVLHGIGRDETDFVFNLTFWLLVTGFFGARLFWILTTEAGREDFGERPLHALFAVWDGGIVYYGGLLFATAFAFWYLWKKDRKILEFGDLLIIGVALTLFIGRWACFSAGCDRGIPTEAAWGLAYEPPEGMDSLIPKLERGIHLHPAQLYMSLNGLVIFLLTSAVLRRKRFDGQILWLFMMLYAVGRSLIELYRGDAERGIYSVFGLDLSSSQIISVPVFLIAGWLYLRGWRRSRRTRKEEAAPAS
jgi:phosphatidylglycerol:prolipoprotein diacylglycerol transferase